MFPKITKIGSMFAAAALGTLAFLGDASAVNLNTHGAAFQPYNASQATLIDYVISGVRTLHTSDTYVIGSIVRSPGAASQSFWIDGTNYNGATTYFTLYAHDYTGTLQSSVSFNSNAANYDLYQTLPTVSTYTFVSMLASLPANANGVLRGVVAIQ